jgi:hypothetical protein
MSQSPLKFLSGVASFGGGLISSTFTGGAGSLLPYGGIFSKFPEVREKLQQMRAPAAADTPAVGSIAKSEAGEGVRKSGFGGRKMNIFNRPYVEGAASLATKAEAQAASSGSSVDLSGIESRLASIEQKLSGSETAMGSVGPTAPPVIEPSLPSAADELGAQYMPTPFFLKQRDKMGALMFKDQTGDGKITQADVIKARIEGYKK